jgi:hypothetical protein
MSVTAIFPPYVSAHARPLRNLLPFWPQAPKSRKCPQNCRNDANTTPRVWQDAGKRPAGTRRQFTVRYLMTCANSTYVNSPGPNPLPPCAQPSLDDSLPKLKHPDQHLQKPLAPCDPSFSPSRAPRAQIPNMPRSSENTGLFATEAPDLREIRYLTRKITPNLRRIRHLSPRPPPNSSPPTYSLE